tara:strand:+ start:67 stop:207 length:141 start_codon:yes stop_codon:yes gene_type:complete
LFSVKRISHQGFTKALRADRRNLLLGEFKLNLKGFYYAKDENEKVR